LRRGTRLQGRQQRFQGKGTSLRGRKLGTLLHGPDTVAQLTALGRGSRLFGFPRKTFAPFEDAVSGSPPLAE
jgi:hypothetical protein